MIGLPSTLMMLPVSDIHIGARVGFFHADHAGSLAQSMSAVGQVDPIHVARSATGAAKPWTLVAGRHRIAAAEQCGFETIAAVVVADASQGADMLRRLELSENLDHRNPRPIERAIFIEARARLDDPEPFDMPPHARASKVRHVSPAATVAAGETWIERVSKSLGISDRTLRNYRAIHRGIVTPFPDLAEALNAHRLGESLSAMLRLTQLGEAERRRVIEVIVTDAGLATIDAAIAAAGMNKNRGTRADDKVMRLFEKLDKVERLRFGKALVEWAEPDARRDIGIAAIARCPDRRAEFIAAAWAGLNQDEQGKLLEKAAQLTIDLSEFGN